MRKEIIIQFLKKNIVWIIYIFSFAIVAFYLISKGHQIAGDSGKYINLNPQRPPGYPLFLSFFKIFGDNYLDLVVYFQVFLNIFALIYFVNYLKKLFSLPAYSLLFVLPLLLFSINHYFFSNAILTEGISIPIFLIMSVFLFRAIEQLDYKMLLIAMGLNALLVLIRGQFLFMYPVFMLCIFYFYFQEKNILSSLKYIALLGLVFLGQQFLNKTYHYFVHGEFISTPSSNMALAANVFYVSSRDDVNNFQKEEDQKLFTAIYDSIYKHNYTLNSFRNHSDEWSEERSQAGETVQQVEHYSSSFNEILHRTINVILQNHYKELGGIQHWEAINNKAMDLALPLMKKNWLPLLKNNFLDVAISGFESRVNIILFLSLMLVSLFSLIKGNMFGSIFSLITIMHLLNYILVAIGGRVLPRYSIYTSLLLVLCSIFLIMKFLINKNN